MEADVVVIGGGLAGTMAALRAAERGSGVVLIRKGYGSSAMSSGTIDIAGPEQFLPMDAWDTLPRIGDRLKEILRTNPLHPYSIVAGGRTGIDNLQERLREACDFTLRQTPGLGLSGSHGQNVALPTVAGTVKFTAFAPASLIEGNLSAMTDANVLLVGFKGLALFHPHICKQALARYSSLHSPRCIAEIDVIECDVPGSQNGRPLKPFEIAKRFDDLHAAEEFARSLAGQLPPKVTHVGFPPVLGLDNHSKTCETFRRHLTPRLFEMIAPNFSVPGYRLQLSLDAALRNSSVRVVTAEAVDAKRDGRIVRNLLLGDMKSKRTATAKNYVVATGKFSSGGLVANDFPKEPIFGLPLFCHDKRADDNFIGNLLRWNVDSKQLFLSCGIHIDSALRPLDAFGEPAYENLFAAGSIIGEYDYVSEKCGMGVAALTGYLAGEKAAAEI
ncbi:anaerobic glycerol-3-phosphate dehydrogenase subunit B [Candidatus Poribacteria bacterium]|nr:anaerobic glycerol-3-phosphate dehydrogenase subunit B [Candidatus Poribacteria bacterium]